MITLFIFPANIVIDLSIAPEDPFTLIATWSQHNEDICSLSYKVTYAIGTQTQTSAVSVPRTTFDIQYCVVAMVTLVPSAFDGEYTGSQTLKATRQGKINHMTIWLIYLKWLYFRTKQYCVPTY